VASLVLAFLALLVQVKAKVSVQDLGLRKEHSLGLPLVAMLVEELAF
jgi:hypothetical protein